MDWDQIVKVVGGTAAVVAAGAWVAQALIKHVFSRDLENHKLELQTIKDQQIAEFKSQLQTQDASKERIRAEVVRWANPILGAVDTLDSRLANILEKKKKGYLALRKNFSHPKWSITYDYFMSSSLYSFAIYFSWVNMLRETMSFELFRSQQEKDDFITAIDAVSSALRAYPPKKYSCEGPDVQVFAMQQQAIGEAMVHSTGERPSCMSYNEFLTTLEEPHFAERLVPLRALLDEVTPQDECRWKRLEATHSALRALRIYCRQLLNLGEK